MIEEEADLTPKSQASIRSGKQPEFAPLRGREEDFSSYHGSFLRAYGFKNLQNAKTKALGKRDAKSNAFKHMELMACPSSCLNGGGQLVVGNGKTHVRRMKARVAE